jgi:hypothetical protein
MEIEQALNSLIASSPLLLSLAPFAGWLKFWITKDLISKDELEKIILALKHDLERELDEKQGYLEVIDKKAQTNAKAIARVEGRLDS